MILGIGTDIFLMNRIVKEVLEDNDPFLRRAFTTKERKNANIQNIQAYYASRFSAKEAVYKAISWVGIEFKPGEIEILNDENGRVYANLLGKTKSEVEKKLQGKYSILVSLSYDHEYANAVALIQEEK